MKWWKIIRTTAIVLLLLFAVLVGTAYCQLRAPIRATQGINIVVREGEVLGTVLRRLEQEHFLPHATLLYYYARLSQKHKIKIGHYAFVSGMTPLEVLDVLEEGRVEMKELRLVEGWDRWQVAEYLHEQGWMKREDFNLLCDDADLLAEHDIPGPSCEGYMYPDTYLIAHGLSPRALFGIFFDRFNEIWSQVSHNTKLRMPLNQREFITLASIIEKETANIEERPHIACVFFNRLLARPQWRLQTDPTVIYAVKLENPLFDGALKYAQLELNSAYNTYRVYGLPPGPISNPGYGALQAVAHPEACMDFFFVSRNNGTHEFCPTLKCHQQAVQKWQINYFKKKKAEEKKAFHLESTPSLKKAKH